MVKEWWLVLLVLVNSERIPTSSFSFPVEQKIILKSFLQVVPRLV